jgi:hypothetical protein
MAENTKSKPSSPERDELVKFVLTKAKRSLHQERRPPGYFDEILRKISLIRAASENKQS